MKSKVSNPVLKQNFTIDKIAAFFEHFLSGNEYVNNLQVKEFSTTNNMNVRETLRVKNESIIEDLNVNSNFQSTIMNITETNEIIFDPDAIMRLRKAPIAFKVKDLFEVVTFLKYMIKICGGRLEKCDFKSLYKANLNDDKKKLLGNLNTITNDYEKYLKEVDDKIINQMAQEFKQKQEEVEKESEKEQTKTNSEMKKMENNLNQKNKNLRNNYMKTEPSQNFKFKESSIYNSHESTNEIALVQNKEIEEPQIKVNKDIEKQIDYEYSNFKNSEMEQESLTNFDDMLANPIMNSFLSNYYYGI